MTVKDWLTLAISIFALVIAAATATFNVILQLDDVRVVLGDHPAAFINDQGAVALKGAQEFTFINSGSRAAAVTSVGGMAFSLKSEDDPFRDCNPEITIGDSETSAPSDSRGAIPINLDASQVVLKPGDIVVVQAKPSAGFLWDKKRDGSVVFPRTLYKPKDTDYFLVCLNLNVVTPDNIITRWRKPAFIVTLSNSLFKTDTKLFEEETPIIIVRRVSTVLRRYF